MATTSPDNLRTPDPGDSYNLVADLATLAGDVQTALNLRDQNVLKGTAAQRAIAESTAAEGMLWVDTDGIKMIWRKGVTVWEPAVWDWTGTNTQMTGFAPPDGFKWYNTTNNTDYVRFGGSWQAGVSSDLQLNTTNSIQPLITQHGIGFITSAATNSVTKTVTFPRAFSGIPVVTVSYSGAKNSVTFDPSGLIDLSNVYNVRSVGPAPTGFSAVAARTDGANMGPPNWHIYFSWSATGVLA